MRKLIFIPILFAAALAYAQKAAAPVSEKAEKMVEIAVEITEINENKSVQLGIEWPSEVGVSEMTIPSIIESGEWARTTNYSATLKALETAGAAKILSKPKLVTKSGTTAKFMVGGEMPVVTSSLSGTSVDWKDYGIMMDITPIIMQDNRIDMDLKTELSRIDYNAPMVGGYYSIAKRQASSHLQIKDGETMVLAGLIETTKGNTKQGIPILSDIPVLGALFSVNTTNETKTNVLIFVTTKIIE